MNVSMSVDHVRADGCLDIQTINHHMEVKAASLSSHVKIHKPVTTAKWSSTTHRFLNKKKRQLVQKRHARVPDRHLRKSHLLILLHERHTRTRGGGAAPVLRCAGRFPFCLTGGPAAAAGLHSALQLACIFLHVASHSYVSTYIDTCLQGRRQGKAGGYADGLCGWKCKVVVYCTCSEVHVPLFYFDSLQYMHVCRGECNNVYMKVRWST
jgi:hypothetical protein